MFGITVKRDVLSDVCVTSAFFLARERNEILCRNCRRLVPTTCSTCIIVINVPKTAMRSRPVYAATIAACVAYFAFALVEAVMQDTLLDLAEVLDTSLLFVNDATAAARLCYCLGALFFGFLLDHHDHRSIISACILATAVTTVVIPAEKNPWFLMFLFLMNGFARGGLDVGVTTWMLAIWSKNANVVMLTMHSSYVLAATMTPMLLPPFLSRKPDAHTGLHGRESHISVLYTVASFICILPFSLILGHRLFYRSPCESEQPLIPASADDTAASTDRRTGWKRAVATLLACCAVGFFSGMNSLFITLLPQFVVFSDLHLSKATGVRMLSAFLACTGMVKILSVFVATRVSTKVMILLDLGIVWTGNLLMSLFANTSETMMWLSTDLIGIGAGSCIPSLLSFMGQKISRSGWTTGCMLAAGRISAVPLMVFVSSFLKDTPLVFVYSNMASVSLAALSFLALLASFK